MPTKELDHERVRRDAAKLVGTLETLAQQLKEKTSSLSKTAEKAKTNRGK